jgi:hypothetical protein
MIGMVSDKPRKEVLSKSIDNAYAVSRVFIETKLMNVHTTAHNTAGLKRRQFSSVLTGQIN